MEHNSLIEYRIYPNVYDEMISGQKNIEFRLLNEKSERIKIGDKIKFRVVDNDYFLIVEVTNKYIYADVDELWKDKEKVSNNALNYTKEEFVDALYKIFGEAEVNNSKIVGIEFKLS